MSRRTRRQPQNAEPKPILIVSSDSDSDKNKNNEKSKNEEKKEIPQLSQPTEGVPRPRARTRNKEKNAEEAKTEEKTEKQILQITQPAENPNQRRRRPQRRHIQITPPPEATKQAETEKKNEENEKELVIKQPEYQGKARPKRSRQANQQSGASPEPEKTQEKPKTEQKQPETTAKTTRSRGSRKASNSQVSSGFVESEEGPPISSATAGKYSGLVKEMIEDERRMHEYDEDEGLLSLEELEKRAQGLSEDKPFADIPELCDDENDLSDQSKFSYATYIVKREKQTKMGQQRIHFQLLFNNEKMYHTKMKSSPDVIYMSKGGAMHFSSHSYPGCIVPSDSFTTFELHDSDKDGRKIFTMKYNKSTYEGRTRDCVLSLYDKESGAETQLSSLHPTIEDLESPIGMYFNERKAVKSVKNLLLFDSHGDEVIAVRKIAENTLAVDAPTKLGKKLIFSVGVCAFLCSI